MKAHSMLLSLFTKRWPRYTKRRSICFRLGSFILIEQQLADLTHDGAMETAATDTRLLVVTEYYRDHLKIDLTQFGSWDVIQEMRLLANATKHGEGGSAEELRKIRPELFQHPALRFNNETVVQFRSPDATYRPRSAIRWTLAHTVSSTQSPEERNLVAIVPSFTTATASASLAASSLLPVLPSTAARSH
jgi:hypothetical protein